MSLRILFAAALVVASLLLVGGASAQSVDGGNATVQVGGNDASGCTEHIGQHVSLCSASVEDGRVHLTLISDEMEIVTITDAGGIMEGGEIRREDVRLRSDRRTTFTMSVTKANGFVGVTIDTGDVLYGKVIEEQTPAFLPRPRKTDAALVGLTVFGLFAVALPGSWYAIKRARGGEEDVF